MALNLNNNFNNYGLEKLAPNVIYPQQYRVSFKQNSADRFTSNPIKSNYVNKHSIQQMIESNPNVTNILKKHNIKPEINMKVLQELSENHMNATKQVALGIYDNLPENIKKEIDKKSLLEAAELHDFGKVLIPNSIVNKKTSLNPKETDIMKLHSELGYELLQTQNLSPKTLSLIKYHHQNKLNTGYPKINDLYTDDLTSQVLHVADVYSALREKRSYKNALLKEESLSIVKKDLEKGICDQSIYDALVDYTKQEKSI